MFNGLKEDTGAHRNVIGVLEGVQSSAVTVRQERCAQVRNRNARCMKCAEACTSGCISIVDGRLTIDASKCVGCGTCATVCPTCALETHNPNDAELLAACRAAASDGRVAIVCRQLREALLVGLLDQDHVAEVVCLGRVEESLLVRLAADGVHEVRLCHGACDACAQRPGLDCARMVAESANGLLAAWGSDACVTVADEVPAYALANGASEQQARAAVQDYFSVPRANVPVVVSEAERALEGSGDAWAAEPSSAEGVSRAAAAQVGTAAASAALEHEPVKQAEISQDGTRKRTAPTTDAPAVLKVMRDGTLPHFLPDRRAKLLDALSDLGKPQAGSIRTRLWGCVVINGAKCSSCRMCATFCPTGALSKFDCEDGTFGVEHYPGDCVKCGTCRDICPEGAIMILDDVKPEYLLGGTVHTYRMKPRSVRLNNEHQIWRTMQLQTDGDIWER